MLKPALAAFAFALVAAVAGGADAHDFGGIPHVAHDPAPSSQPAHKPETKTGYKPAQRYDQGRDRFKRHPHYRNGKRVVHSHAIKRPPSVGSSSLYRLPSSTRR